jgi:hypothetical protein
MLTPAESKRLAAIQSRITIAKAAGQSVELTPDDEQLLDDVALRKHRANIRTKALRGDTLTAAQQATLAGAKSGGGYALNLDDLGDACGVDRRTLANAKKRNAREYAKRRKLLERADGRYCIAEWIRFLKDVGVEGRRGDAELEDERAVKLDLLKIERDTKRFNLERIRDQLLAVAQFEAALAATVSNFLQALNAFGGRINEAIEGLEFNDRADVIEREVELLRATLASCDFLKADGDEE